MWLSQWQGSGLVPVKHSDARSAGSCAQGCPLGPVLAQLRLGAPPVSQRIANMTTKPLVVVLTHGGPIDLSEMAASPRVSPSALRMAVHAWSARSNGTVVSNLQWTSLAPAPAARGCTGQPGVALPSRPAT